MLATLLASLTLLVASGCGKAKPARPPLHPASGQVTFRGKPAAGVTVTFHPCSTDFTLVPTATTGPDGTYTVGTFAVGDGLPVGDYVVTVTWWHSDDPDGDKPLIDRFKGKYAEPSRFTIKVHIEPQANLIPPIALN